MQLAAGGPQEEGPLGLSLQGSPGELRSEAADAATAAAPQAAAADTPDECAARHSPATGAAAAANRPEEGPFCGLSSLDPGEPLGPWEAAAGDSAGDVGAGHLQERGLLKRRRGSSPTEEVSDGHSKAAAAAATAAATAAAAADTGSSAAAGYTRRGKAKRGRGGPPVSQTRSHSLMHPRSRFFGGPLNFPLLAEKHPPLSAFLSVSPSGHLSFDFSSREAQLQLCIALFRCIYSLSFSLPSTQNFLVPTLPNRSHYIHFLADLLSDAEGLGPPRGPPIPGGGPYILRPPPPPAKAAEDLLRKGPPNLPQGGASCLPVGGAAAADVGGGGPPRGPLVRVLDVGVGASCVYPLLGVADYDWSFVGSDVSADSLAAAAANVRLNGWEERISLRKQTDRKRVFRGVVLEGDPLFAASVCNPPFYASEEEVGLNPRREKGGSADELICEGGEEGFLFRMLAESKSFCCRFLWFSTLVARATTRDRLKREIHAGMRKAGKQQEVALQQAAEGWLAAGSSSDSSSNPEAAGREAAEATADLHPRELRIFELSQGKQTRWVVAWTYWTKAQRQLLPSAICASARAELRGIPAI
ncbi:hypothetical protein Efla_001540 [Eimeria flavescens]